MSDVDLRLGDCQEVLKTLPPLSVDLTVTSPPYDNLRQYNGYTFDAMAIASELWRVTKQGGVVVWVVGDETKDGSESGTSFRQALGFMGLGFNMHDTMIYEVAGTGAKGSTLAYWQAFEYMFVFSKGRPTTHNLIRDKRNINAGAAGYSRSGVDGKPKIERPHLVTDVGIRTNIWRYAVGFANGSDTVDHPAPFPEALARDHILSWSNPGDVVLDPMMGSGTTGKMAVKYQRNFIGCEISDEYFKIAERRIAAAQSQLVMPLFG